MLQTSLARKMFFSTVLIFEKAVIWLSFVYVSLYLGGCKTLCYIKLLHFGGFFKPHQLNLNSGTWTTKMHAMRKEQKENNINTSNAEASRNTWQYNKMQIVWTLFTNGTKLPAMVRQQVFQLYWKHFKNLPQIRFGPKLKHRRNSLVPTRER